MMRIAITPNIEALDFFRFLFLVLFVILLVVLLITLLITVNR